MTYVRYIFFTKLIFSSKLVNSLYSNIKERHIFNILLDQNTHLLDNI